MATKEDILGKLRLVKDPELGINIVDLGLIYEVGIKEKKVLIKMTFTTPACPMMNYMLMQAKERLEELPDLDIEIEIVFDPPWSPERLSKEAKLRLGMI